MRKAILLLAIAANPLALQIALAQQPEPGAAQRYFTDIVLVDQNGTSKRFYTDLLKGKVVVINSFFSSCKDSCPLMAGALAKVQDWLGDRLGTQAYLISISVDPETDTPERLKAYAERFKAKPGWFFLTGKKENVSLALRKLGQYVDEKNDHLSMFLLGNDSTGLWKKVPGTARSDQVISALEPVLTDRSR